tara:strand:+ start:400 stop:711 length:312 start_codon:yes stop_codon:yes gene_type:complete
MQKQFRRIKFGEMENLCNTGVVRKGALLKYRWSDNTIHSYELDQTTNEWRYGIVSEIMWYVMKPTIVIEDKDGMLCHEIGVRDTADNKYIIIDLKHYEICTLE